MNSVSLKSACSIAVLSVFLSTSPSLAQEMPSPEEMWKIILQQQEQISRLEEKLGITEQAVTETQEQVAETQAKVAETDWKNTAFTGRLSWMPIAGVNLAASFQYGP